MTCEVDNVCLGRGIPYRHVDGENGPENMRCNHLELKLQNRGT